MHPMVVAATQTHPMVVAATVVGDGSEVIVVVCGMLMVVLVVWWLRYGEGSLGDGDDGEPVVGLRWFGGGRPTEAAGWRRHRIFLRGEGVGG
ncbi:hypothetical protein Tco_0807769 [Tanacetum coccineum]